TRSKRDWSSDVCSSDLYLSHSLRIVFLLPFHTSVGYDNVLGQAIYSSSQTQLDHCFRHVQDAISQGLHSITHGLPLFLFHSVVVHQTRPLLFQPHPYVCPPLPYCLLDP